MTTAPAPTTALRPIVIAGSTVALAPIFAPGSIVGPLMQRDISGQRGWGAFVSTTRGPIQQPALMTVYSGTKACEWMRDAILDDHVMLDHAMAADGDGIADDIALAEERTVAGLKATANGVAGVDDGMGPDRGCRTDIRGERPWVGTLWWLANDDEIANGAAYA